MNKDFEKQEFQELWKRINQKAAYTVHFDTKELVGKCIRALDVELKVSPLQYTVQRDERLTGARQTRPFENNARVEKDDFFILGGQLIFVAEVGETIRAPNGALDARLRVIYSNGTESNLLRRSLQRALNKDEMARRLTDANAESLFSGTVDEDDLEATQKNLRLSTNGRYFRRAERCHNSGVLAICACPPMSRLRLMRGRSAWPRA